MMDMNNRMINSSTAVAALAVVLSLKFSLWFLFLLLWVAI